MKVYLTLLFFLFSIVISAQLTVKGVVLDESNQPIPYVNVIVKNTTIGKTTNDNGNFSITLKKNRGLLEISLLGYKTIIKKVTKKTRFLTIILKEEASQLEEIIIVTKPKKRLKKKENPAYKILKEIWKNKKTNGLKLFNSYQYKKLLTTEIGLNNLDSAFLKKTFKKQYENILNQLPYNDNGINFYIPLFISETVSKVYGNNIINKERIDIEAEKSRGLDRQGFVFERVSNAFNDINIYDDNFQLLRKSFVSPISKSGFDTYDYVLRDSITKDDKKFYNIYFFPRRNDLAFKGNFWVENKTFAITKIKMETNKDMNINFVRRISLAKEFLITKDSIYLPKKDIYNANFALNDDEDDDDQTGLTLKKTTEFSRYSFDKPKSDNFYSEKIIRFKPKQFSKKENYWDSINKNNITAEKYTLIKNIKKDKEIRKITGLLTTLSTGYVQLAPRFQIGQYWNTITKNGVEGVKITQEYFPDLNLTSE